MSSPLLPCPRCGKIRKVRGRANNPCMDCRRADNFTYGPQHALTGGRWETRGLTQVWVGAPVQPEKPKRSYLKHDEHGSVAGYRRHQNHDTEPCDECREAMRHHWRLYANRARNGNKLPLSPCGTYNAYVRHRRHGEEPCDECLQAFRAYTREYRRRARAQRDERKAA